MLIDSNAGRTKTCEFANMFTHTSNLQKNTHIFTYEYVYNKPWHVDTSTAAMP